MLMCLCHGANTMSSIVQLSRLAFVSRFRRCGCEELFALAIPSTAAMRSCMHMLSSNVFE